MCFKIDLVSLLVERKFTVLLCFMFYLRAISKYKPPGVLYLEGRFNEGFFCIMSLGALYLEGLIHGGAYFRNFAVFSARVMRLHAYITQALRNNNLVTRGLNQIMAVQNRCAIVWSACDNST